MKPNIRLISKLTGFSPATVSNALNKKRGVNKETAELILKTADELGYNFEPKVKKIKFLCCKRHGMIINNSSFFSEVISGAETQARELGFQTVFVNFNINDINYQYQIKKAIDDSSCSAYILFGTELAEEDFEIFKNIKKPFVIVDSSCSKYNFDCVVINNAESVQFAVNFLIENGHKKIGYLRGKYRTNSFKSRAMGYKKAMNAAELPIKDGYVITLSTTSEQAFMDMNSYLESKRNLPTAFFADNDQIALGAMKALQKHGYKIPEDISIIGFDDIDFSEFSSPRLTTMRVHKKEIGKLAVIGLVNKINTGSRVNTKTYVYTDFIERDSVKCVKKRY